MNDSGEAARVLGGVAGGVISYFAARKKDGGGFAMTGHLPATIEDTYYALRTLSLLAGAGIAVPEELLSGHGGFLASRAPGTDPRTAWQLAWSRRMTGIAPGVDRPLGAGNSLDGAFYLARLHADFGAPMPVVPGHAPLSGAVRTVRDARMFLFVMMTTGKGLPPEERRRWAEWLRASRNPDGGFGFMPGTTSFMENTWYAVSALALLDEAPGPREELMAFTVSAQSKAGGFGRRNMGVAFPGSTWCATAILGRLAGVGPLL